MDKRYQVFVSSTYEDLRAERQEVMQALLELDCIPAGMELFPAANDDQWTLIKKVIDDCDYYIVIIGGRYGSVGPQGKSYTQMEYEYAVSRGKPVIAFLHEDPNVIPVGKAEKSDDGKKRLESFREIVKAKVVKPWSSAQDLGSVVSRSIVKLIKSTPAVGWVRANELVEGVAAQELLRLRKEIEELQARLQRSREQPPPGAEELASGSEDFEVEFEAECEDQIGEINTRGICIAHSWNTICKLLLPTMIDRATTSQLSEALESYNKAAIETKLRRKGRGITVEYISVEPRSLQTIIVQLRALGLIDMDQRQRSVTDSQSYWTLTPYGDNVMTRLNAIRKGAATRLKE